MRVYFHYPNRSVIVPRPGTQIKSMPPGLSQAVLSSLPAQSKVAVIRSLERNLNSALKDGWANVITPRQRKVYQALYDRDSEATYASADESGNRSRPKGLPNEAYMRSLLEMWNPAERILILNGLELSTPLRDLFHQSDEMNLPGGDPKNDHLRIFRDTLRDAISKSTMFSYELKVPHSHKYFDLQVPTTINLLE